jgi:exopolyphosphatase/guanosine-5'-triphosphate,3'-diphosphate pyrophosphatase
MDKRIAVIDLGTNTCNLLIAEISNGSHRLLFQDKELVKLGKEGIEKNLLSHEGLERTIKAIKKHQHSIRLYNQPETHLLATSAIREATNKDWFIQEVFLNTGMMVKVISGEEEAQLIYKGVKLAFGQMKDDALILDIGGGSNEFIFCKNGVPLWAQSFPLGIARVIEKIPPSDPITSVEIQQIMQYFELGLSDLWKRLENTQPSVLIGCSGAFDTLTDLIDRTYPGSKLRVQQEIRLVDFYDIYQLLIRSVTAERLKMTGMEPIRVEMIVAAVILIRLVIEKLNINKIFQTDYALREGVLLEHILS